VADAVCKSRLRERNRTGEHGFTVSDADFDLIARHFIPPSPDEGFDVSVYGDKATADLSPTK